MPHRVSIEASPGEELLRAALAGDTGATRALVRALLPEIRIRVTKGLLRRRAGAKNRDIRQEIDDMTQEVLVALFEEGGRVLRNWDPHRGLSLKGFVGLVAEREVHSILRSGRRSPWRDDPTLSEELDSQQDASRIEEVFSTKQLLKDVLERLHERLSPYGARLFALLVVEERSVEEVCREMQMNADAVYAWRSRLAKQARQIGQELLQERSKEAS